jgi:hypothetical protein
LKITNLEKNINEKEIEVEQIEVKMDTLEKADKNTF